MKKEYLPGLVFLVFLGAFALLLFVLPPRGYSEREKRYLVTAPQIDADTIRTASLSQTLEEAAADQFPLRDLFVGVNAYAELAEGRNTAQGVLMGADGRLFAAPAQDTGKLRANLAAAQTFAAQTDARVLFTAIPQAGCIYEDALPALAPPYDDAQTIAQIEAGVPDAQFIDVTSLLSEKRDAQSLYYKTDHHLTSAGAYLVYTRLCGALGLSPAPEEEFTVERYDGFYGTAFSSSGYWLTQPDGIELWRWDGDADVTVEIPENGTVHEGLFFPEHLAGEDKYPVYLDGNHALTHLHNDAAPEGTLVLIKDSFAHCLSCFLARHYRDIYLVDLRYYKEPASELVEETGADTVLILYGVSNLLTDSSLVWLR